MTPLNIFLYILAIVAGVIVAIGAGLIAVFVLFVILLWILDWLENLK